MHLKILPAFVGLTARIKADQVLQRNLGHKMLATYT